MKKWIFLYILICVGTLGIVLHMGALMVNDNADYLVGYKDNDISYQIVNFHNESFIIIDDKSEDDARRISIDEEGEYIILDSVLYLDKICYVYQYKDDEKAKFGLGSYDYKNDSQTKYAIDGFKQYDFCDLGVKDEKLYVLLKNDKELELKEFAVSSVESTKWEEQQTIYYPEGKHIDAAAYHNGNISYYLENKKAYYYDDMICKEYTSNKDVSFFDNKSDKLLDTFEDEMKIINIKYVFNKIAVWWLGAMVFFAIIGSIIIKGSFVLKVGAFAQLAFLMVLLATEGGKDKRFSFIILGGMVIVMLFTIMYYRRWRHFSKALISVADNPDIEIVPKRRSGMRKEWNALGRLSHNQEKYTFELKDRVRAYGRFIPKGIDKLMDKKNILNMEVGDYKEIEASICTVNVDYTTNLTGSERIHGITECFRLINGLCEDRGGIIASPNCDLKDMKVIFQKNQENAVDYSVDVIKSINSNIEFRLADKCIIVDKTNCHCGIVGDENRVSPMFYTDNEDILSQYTQKFKQAGIWLILTEDAYKECENKYSFRYIGYVSHNNKNIKLYECLDVYPKVRKEILERNITKFKKALSLFYSNDFYLAKSAFNEVLKENIYDEVARWYLFSCEHNLHSNENNMSYGLFDDKVYSQSLK